ncbi:hypothetical protein BH24ACI3_BH24ACI3_06680 [soil metagenome]
MNERMNRTLRGKFRQIEGVMRPSEFRNCGSPMLVLFIVFILAALPAVAQKTPEYDTAPPPLRIMSPDEREKLDKESGVRKRTELALSLMDLRLTEANNANSRDQLDEIFTHLAAFHAMMEDTLVFLEASDTNKSRVLLNFKRLEIGLRKFTPRLEMIRREMPLTHEFYVRTLMRRLRDARTRAVEPLFGETVLRDGRDR